MSNINSSNNRFINQPVTQTATSYTVSQLNDFIIEVTNTDSVWTITLPPPVLTGNVGKGYVVKDVSGGAQSNNIFVVPASGLIDGAASAKISSNYGSIQIFCDGANYYSFGSNNSGSFIVNKRTFTSSGTYTPTAGMLYCEVEIVGGGGGGGGAPATGALQYSGGSGGGAGEYAVGVFSAAVIGGSQTVTIGSSGISNAGAAGGNGGITALGSLITANGGGGGLSSTSANVFNINGSLGGSGGLGGNYHIPGGAGGETSGSFTPSLLWGGFGGTSPVGAGGLPALAPGVGGVGLGYGGGGAGASQTGSAGALSGGAGASGAIFITEYIATSVASMPVVALAKAAWNKQTNSGFTPATINTSFASDPGTTPSNSASRIDLSTLTQNEGSGITISQFQATILQAGTYQILGSAAFVASVSSFQNCIIQCVKNSTTVLAMGSSQINNAAAVLETGSFSVTLELAVNDVIDFRLNTSGTVAFNLWSLSLSIVQVPSSTLVPVTNWIPVAGTTQLMSPNNSYYTLSSSLTTFTLPVAAAAGTVMQISGFGSGGWILTQNAGQTIYFGNQSTTTGTGGSISSQNPYDGVGLLCATASTQWVVTSATGNLKVV